MKKYLEIAKAYMKTQLIWRTDALVDVVLSVAKILFAWILWSILFEGKEQIAGMGFQTMISYYIVSAYLYQLEKSGEISQQMSYMIRSGTFSKYMVLPVQTEGYFIAMEAGKIAFSGLIGLLASVVWVVLFGIRFVHTENILVLFMGSLMAVMGLLFMAELNYFLGIMTLKVEEIGMLLMIKDNLMALVTGSMIPLVLMPDWLVGGMKLLPFYYVTYLPSMLFIGECEKEAFSGLCILGLWCLVFAVLNKVTYRRYRIKFDGAGL